MYLSNYVEKIQYLKINTNNLYIIGIVILCSIWKSLRLSIVTKQFVVKQNFLWPWWRMAIHELYLGEEWPSMNCILVKNGHQQSDLGEEWPPTKWPWWRMAIHKATLVKNGNPQSDLGEEWPSTKWPWWRMAIHKVTLVKNGHPQVTLVKNGHPQSNLGEEWPSTKWPLGTSIPKHRKCVTNNQMNDVYTLKNVYRQLLPSSVVCCQMTSYFENNNVKIKEVSMIVYVKSLWNRIHFIVSHFDASNVSPYLNAM